MDDAWLAVTGREPKKPRPVAAALARLRRRTASRRETVIDRPSESNPWLGMAKETSRLGWIGLDPQSACPG